MPICKSRTKKPKNIMVGFWLAWIALLIAKPSFAEDKVTDIYTLPNIPIKEFHNKVLPGSVANDRQVLLGSVGSDLWHGPTDPRDEFWMVTDRGPNGQIKVNGTNRRTFWVPEFNPMILRVKQKAKKCVFWKPYPSSANRGSR